MSPLFILFTAMIALAMLFVMVPLWRYRGEAVYSSLALRKQKNHEVFQQRIGELELELQQELINAEEHAKLLAELQRAFLRDIQALDSQTQGSNSLKGSRVILTVLVLLIPLMSFWQYSTWGSGADLALPKLLQEVKTAEDEATQKDALENLATFLQQRLSRRPDDIQNGYMLGTLYTQLENFADAEATFRQMLTQMDPNADRATVLGQLAQAQYLLHDSKITAEVQVTIDEALGLDTNEYSVMSILAIDAFLKEDVVGALGYWRRQLSAATPGSQEADALRERITMVESYLPAEQVVEAKGPTITLVINVAPEVAAQVDPTMRLFVFVRNPAMPMPILAQNIPLPEFPFSITLDNSMSMTGMTMDPAVNLIAGARISASGNALAQSGDMQTVSAPFLLPDIAAPLELLIDEVVP
ncbi:MAG: c-type cytochrome biogenesis protein CcmI [Pseudohongiellaceae bacterium]